MGKKSRQTKQKELLEEELNKFSTLFTAEDLLEKAQKRDHKLGIATVYRFLKELRQEHLCHTYQCSGKTIYSRESTHHCHFHCQKCGKEEHFSVENLDFLQKKVPGEICHFQIDAEGICRNCLQKEKTQ